MLPTNIPRPRFHALPAQFVSLFITLLISLFIVLFFLGGTSIDTTHAAPLQAVNPTDEDASPGFSTRLPFLTYSAPPSAPVPSPIVPITTGGNYTCALTEARKVYCWGAGSTLGNGTTTPSPVPVAVEGLGDGVQAIDSSGYYACALLSDRTVSCWGAYQVVSPLQQVADSEPTIWIGNLVPIKVEGIHNKVAAIAVSNYGGCALQTRGAVQCWAHEYDIHRTSPEPVAGLESGVIAITNGDFHFCALLQDGTVRCWGNNDWTQLGDGTTESRATPVSVQGLEGKVKAIAAGGYTTCALLESGTVQCWGQKIVDQRFEKMPPTVIEGLDGPVAAIALGARHICALLESGEVQCWGANEYGQLGNGNTTDSTTPGKVANVKDAVAMALGTQHSCARLEDGHIQCWGDNGVGELGDGGYLRLHPVTVVGLGEPIASLVADTDQSCVLLESGAVRCWGDYSKNQWGGSSPKEITGLKGKVKQVAVGGSSTCGVLDDSTLQCWSPFDSSPTFAPAPNGPVESVATSGSLGCVLLQGGSVQCWGNIVDGPLGDGSGESSLDKMVQVQGLDHGVIAVATTFGHSCALLENGGMKCWGGNFWGQLGDGTTTDRLTPTDVIGLDGPVKAMALAPDHTCALLQSGTVQCWGWNYYGQLGDGTTTDRNTPTEVVGLGENVQAIAVKDGHSCALLEGEVLCWGANWAGQLGNENLQPQLTPVKVEGLPATGVAIVAGAQHSCVLLEDDSVRCWGHADLVGDGVEYMRQLTPVNVLWPLD